MSPFIQAFLGVLAVSLVSLAGVVTLAMNEQRLRRALFFLVALSVGALFGDVFIHLLPEIFEESANFVVSSSLVLLGIVIFFVLEKFLRWGHAHEVEECEECVRHVHPVGPLNLVSDALHNLIDGMIIGASFLAGPAVGIATTVAVVLHEIPQEIGDFALLVYAGYSRGKALLLNLLSALFAILGVALVFAFGPASEAAVAAVLPVAAGGFIYIAGSDLVPELHRTVGWKKSLLQFVAITIGVGLMFLLLLLE